STSQQATNADKTETDTQQKEQPPAAVNATQDNQPVLSEADTIYINNAGLVIVAPYLGRFFDKLGLLNDNQINNVSRAITLLQHIVTGEN
ncbi:contractile injection system tape measure protein, partial [Escherichia coli]|nr:contractile injection system tape measure protein [Escherichia coli]